MKKISVKKEILTVTLIVLAILFIGSQVFATGTSDSPIQIPIINTNTSSVDTNTQSNAITNETTNVVTPTTNVVAPTTNTTGSTYQNQETLPQTGDASDYAIFILIVVAAVVAVYAYRKVREYNF